MLIYLAGSCDTENRTTMVKIANQIRELHFCEVYCPWELKIPNAWDISQEKWAQKVFDADVKAIDESDLVVLISVGRNSTAGTNWEQGYAYGTNKSVLVFQITEETTSLMTFCGSTAFFNVKNTLEMPLFIKSTIRDFIFSKNKSHDHSYCKTILT